MKTSKKGISLIVLVITIIVMIILATAIILSLNSSNIVEKAKEAKTASDLANAKNVVILAKGEWELMTESEKASNGVTFNVYAESKLQEAGYKVNENDGLNVSSNGVVSTVYVGSDNRKAIIPEGFTVSTKSTEDSVTEGLVISDAKGNEFVWVPVDDFTKFERTTTYDGTITDPDSDYTEPVASSCSDFDISEWKCNETTVLSISNDLTGEWKEYTAMKASVQENKGFYIGRYETGKEGTNTPVIKKGATVWAGISWGASMADIKSDVVLDSINYGKGAVYYSRNMYKSSLSVVSTLCYGVQWDSALQFIAKTDADYPINSANKGNYSDDVVKTGYYAVNNIYDMAGNIAEWTMEGWSNLSRVVRSGIYDGGFMQHAASVRHEDEAYGPYGSNGFRIALYLK